MAFGTFSTFMPVEVVAEGGMLVRQVDVNGAALDDPTDIYSLAIPCTLVDGAGTTENGNATFSVWLKVTLSPNGVAVIRCDAVGNAVNTPFDTETIPTLSPLTLNTSTVSEDAAAATVVGTIQGKSASSVLSLVDDAGGRFTLAGSDIQATGTGLNYESATSHNITVRETLAGASNTPRDSIITINVTNVLEVTLSALGGTFSLSETAASGAIAGALTGVSSGSTLSLVDDAGGRVALSGNNIVRGATSLDYETATSHSFTVRETHADGSNSPLDTVLSLTVTDVDDAAPQNTVAPVISGGNEIGDTLTVTDGTWDKARTYTGRFWFSSPNAIVGETETSETQLDPDSMTSFGPLDATVEGLYIACLVVGCNENGCTSAWSNVIGPIIDAADVTAPTLSSQSGAATGETTANLLVTTNEDNGTLYWVVTTSATSPTKAQVKAGQDHTGAAAADSGSQAVSSSGIKNASATGLTADTDYYAHFMHEDTATNQSNVVSSTVFTTDAEVSGETLSDFNAVQTSTPTTAPFSFSGTIGDDIEPLFILEIRRSPDGVKDGNGDYVTVELSVSHILSYEEHGDGFIPEANLIASGWEQPTGEFHEMYWWSDGGSQTGPRSELTDTIADSVATWTATDGDSRSSMVDTSNGNLTCTMGSTPSSPANVRATIPAQQTKSYFEIDCHGPLVNSNGTLMIGVCDLLEDFGPTGLFPFVGRDSPGFGFRFTLGSTSFSRYWDATTKTAGTLSVAFAVGDKFHVEWDEVALTATLYHKPVSTGVWVTATTFTMASSTPAVGDWWAASAGFAATTSWTANFGATAPDRTPTSGYSFYG